jgi:hypothetical protein
MINSAMNLTKAKEYFKKKDFTLAANLEEERLDPVA